MEGTIIDTHLGNARYALRIKDGTCATFQMRAFYSDIHIGDAVIGDFAATGSQKLVIRGEPRDARVEAVGLSYAAALAWVRGS